MKKGNNKFDWIGPILVFCSPILLLRGEGYGHISQI